MGLERNRANSRPPAWRDASGLTLSDYPRPSVAVDIAVLTVPAGGPLSVVIVLPSDHTDSINAPRHRLPGSFLHEGERLSDAALRALSDKAGLRGLDPRQLHVFDEPDRDDRGWVLTVGHIVTVPAHQLEIDTTKAVLVPVDRLPALDYGHDEIVDLAVAAIRADYATEPDPRGLTPAPFTLRDLQNTHEAIAGGSLARDSFRRTMEPALRATGATRRGRVGKPARLYERKTKP